MRLVSMGTALLLMIMACFAAVAEDKTPYQQVEDVTEKLIQTIEETRQYFESDPDRYYQAITELLDPMIDFPSFTRGVMGEYGTRDYYQSLPSAEAKAEFREQYSEFVKVFKQGLMQTYGKGFLAFNGQEIRILEPSKEELALVANKQAVDVRQSIENGEDTYLITYKVRPDKSGQWLLRNVIIESVNVGQLYRNQFVAAMKKHENNFQAVVASWLDESRKASETLREQTKQ